MSDIRVVRQNGRDKMRYTPERGRLSSGAQPAQRSKYDHIHNPGLNRTARARERGIQRGNSSNPSLIIWRLICGEISCLDLIVDSHKDNFNGL